MSSDEAAGATEEVRHDDQRVIVVNSQPATSSEELPPRRLRSLGSVSSHATDPTTSDSQPRRSGRRGNPLLALLLTAGPIAGAAYGITLLEDRTLVLGATAALALVLLVGIVVAWRRLSPTNRDNRGGLWLARAIGLVGGGVAAVYLLLDPVSALL